MLTCPTRWWCIQNARECTCKGHADLHLCLRINLAGRQRGCPLLRQQILLQQ